MRCRADQHGRERSIQGKLSDALGESQPDSIGVEHVRGFGPSLQYIGANRDRCFLPGGCWSAFSPFSINLNIRVLPLHRMPRRDHPERDGTGDLFLSVSSVRRKYYRGGAIPDVHRKRSDFVSDQHVVRGCPPHSRLAGGGEVGNEKGYHGADGEPRKMTSPERRDSFFRSGREAGRGSFSLPCDREDDRLGTFPRKGCRDALVSRGGCARASK